jgi:hypothetical protein
MTQVLIILQRRIKAIEPDSIFTQGIYGSFFVLLGFRNKYYSVRKRTVEQLTHAFVNGYTSCQLSMLLSEE